MLNSQEARALAAKKVLDTASSEVAQTLSAAEVLIHHAIANGEETITVHTKHLEPDDREILECLLKLYGYKVNSPVGAAGSFVLWVFW